MIVVFGSLGVDLVTNVSHIPHPGETVLCEGYIIVPGGKGGNQAVAAARAGSKTRLIGSCGNDGLGRQVRPASRLAVTRTHDNFSVVPAQAGTRSFASNFTGFPATAGTMVNP